jgi:hypothetical protein
VSHQILTTTQIVPSRQAIAITQAENIVPGTVMEIAILLANA